MFAMFRGIKQKHIIALFFVSLALAGAVNYAWQSFAASVTHSFRISNAGGGTVKNLAGNGYAEGYLTVSGTSYVTKSYTTGSTPMQYKAFVNPGFRFMGWEASPSVRDGYDYEPNPFSVNRTRNWTFTAVIKRASVFSVNISGPKITGVQVNCPTDCTVFYDNGQTDFSRTYTASKVNGYTIKGWDTNGDNVADTSLNSYTYTLDTNKSLNIKAIYASTSPPPTIPPPTSPPPSPTTTSYTVSVTSNPSSGGTITGSGTVTAGGSKTLTAKPNAGYKFSSWTGNCSGTSLTYTLNNITANKTCTANFTKISTVIKPYSGNSNKSQGAPTLPEDTEPPTPPSDLVSSYIADKNLVELLWSASEDNIGVEGYEIERRDKGTANWAKITKITSEEYTDFDFIPNKSYEYRVRAFDAKMNFSDYSNTAEVVTGDFKPNITVKDGGTVTDEENKVSVTFPANAVSEDLYVLIEKVNSKEIKGIKLGKNTRVVGDIFSVRAKSSKGEDINKFKTQVTLRFKTDYLKGVNEKSIKLAIMGEDKYTTLLHTNYNEELKSVETLTDHFSIYVMTAPSIGFWGIFIKVMAWIIILGGVGAGGYFGWQKYELAKYQKEHREDYIYKH